MVAMLWDSGNVGMVAALRRWQCWDGGNVWTTPFSSTRLNLKYVRENPKYYRQFSIVIMKNHSEVYRTIIEKNVQALLYYLRFAVVVNFAPLALKIVLRPSIDCAL
uniref:Uncharacterized protein n=1 Tax=Romanomermis culicivorax TaxID=13658 RepID=A0A915I0N6_ROMCU